jgi:cytochrome P450
VDPPRWIRRFQERELLAHVHELHRAVQGFIAKTREKLAARPELRERPENLIQALVAARDRDGALTDEDVAGNVLTMLLAGEDTTANTLAWMLWLLAHNLDALAAAREEVDRVLGDAPGVQSLEQLHQLDVVEACANETMRLRPVAPFIMNECIVDNTAVGDVRVDKGQFVICLMRAPAMDAATFPDPARFDLSRWRGGEGSTHAMASAKRHTMPFGAGPRMCPGRYLALAEIKLAAAMVLKNFDLLEVAPEGGGEPRERITIVMAPEGLRMRVAARR